MNYKTYSKPKYSNRVIRSAKFSKFSVVSTLCPHCESEMKKIMPPPEENEVTEQPDIVKLPPPRRGEEGQGGGSSSGEEEGEGEEESESEGEGQQQPKGKGKKGQNGKQEEQGEKGEGDQQEGEDEKGGKAKAGEEEESVGEGGEKQEKNEPSQEPEPNLPYGMKPEDIQKARESPENITKELKKVEEQTKKDEADKLTPTFLPVSATSAPDSFRDAAFITKMNDAVRDWKVGYKRVVGESGTRLSVQEFIRHRDTPFVSNIKKSAKGKKILVIVDFSGSMASRQDDYKKAIISSMEVLNGIGTETALFGFGGELGSEERFFFRIKKFEEPKWKPDHAAKTSALLANYPGTPTWEIYNGLEKYIKKHKPDVTVTVTDGEPCAIGVDDDKAKQYTVDAIRRLKKNTRMVAFGITPEATAYVTKEQYRAAMDESLRSENYNGYFLVDRLNEIPPKLVKLIAK